ncbi:MAG TPA: hypothetical protein VE981_12460 [Planctomycetota bacterium]|nr:hypothetical protein [Planctomycetota bacterium]
MKNAGILLLLAGCAGAGSARYSDADHRKTVAADLETTFYLSLPETNRDKAVFSPDVLSLGKDGVDEVQHRRILEFTAKGLGETEIQVGSGFSMRVQVTSASDRPGMHLHQH